MRCNDKACTQVGHIQWHNYRVDRGRHVLNGPMKEMQCIMLNARFGVTIAYLEQLHMRLLREHVSFAGEADVAQRHAKLKGCGGMLPKRLRLYLSQAWYF